MTQFKTMCIEATELLQKLRVVCADNYRVDDSCGEVEPLEALIDEARRFSLAAGDPAMRLLGAKLRRSSSR